MAITARTVHVGGRYRFDQEVSIDLASVGANAVAYQNQTVTGLQTDMVPHVTFLADLPAGLIFHGARVSAANTLRLLMENTTGSPIDASAINTHVLAF